MGPDQKTKKESLIKHRIYDTQSKCFENKTLDLNIMKI